MLFNTIDFLVRVKKSKTGEDFIGNVFEDGDNLSETKQLNQYKWIATTIAKIMKIAKTSKVSHNTKKRNMLEEGYFWDIFQIFPVF